jgi:hypothetical protein
VSTNLHAALETPFSLESLREVLAPDGAPGTWHRYVIAQGSNKITGTRVGSRSEVDTLVRDMIEKLNVRYGKQLAKLQR